ncbi:testis-specific H1 histone [Carlito syrichta]|uniref:Testis-specific H1 histone n=1 Tax=Carlito syrichta TaxID=1868482 RepID=A0A3Q0EAM5_CARSF|nr:testis-specific H1 histone [Carlito syrichta]
MWVDSVQDTQRDKQRTSESRRHQSKSDLGKNPLSVHRRLLGFPGAKDFYWFRPRGPDHLCWARLCDVDHSAAAADCALAGETQSRWPRGGGSPAMAEAAEPMGVSQGAEVKTQRPAGKSLGALLRRGPRSVLKVSQLVLGAITAHKGLTLAALKRELGNAGYEVRRKSSRPGGETPGHEAKGTLLRVSGHDASGYFRVWKIPKPKRKLGRPQLEEAVRLQMRTPPRPRRPRRRRTRRKAAKNARKAWRACVRASARARARKVRPRARDVVSARAKEEARAKVVDKGRGLTTKVDARPRSGEQRPSSSKSKEEMHEPKKPVKRTSQKPTPVRSDRNCSGQGKTRTKASTKSEGPRSAAWNP